MIRQEKGLISLQLPNKETSKNVHNVSQILCPMYADPDTFGQSIVFINIYTSSDKNITYTIQASYFKSNIFKYLLHSLIF